MIRLIPHLLILLAAINIADASASYGYYVGKNLTADGSVLLGGTGEEPSSHWLEIVPRQSHARGATITVGATEFASLPARLIEIPQVRETFRYITMNYTSYAGFPAPLTNGGLNEHQVAIRDIWSPSRPELVAMTPPGQTGPNYSDLARIALERATNAREAVAIIGALIDQHGYTTYGGNSHLIADQNEGWVVLEFAGGEGLWVAERLGPDDVRVSYPGYIGDVPGDYRDHDDWMGSPNLISFAVEQGWYAPDSDQPFNVDEVYGLGGIMRHPGTKYVSPQMLEEELRALAPVTVKEMMGLVRDPRIADDHAGYGQVAHLRSDLPHPDLALLWIAPTGSVTAPFLPWWIGTRDVPAEYGQHRYLTEGSGPDFINPDFQLREATEFAGRVFKRLMYFTCAFPEEQLDRVQTTLTAFEDTIRAGLPPVERATALAYAAGEPDTARAMLTRESHARAAEALAIGRDLVAGIGTEVRLRHGIPSAPAAGNINDGGQAVSCLVGADPDRVPADRGRD
ncbi:C69 family dipeptidase [Haliea sp. E1-2-M8]|uniref:C69 family dipeptidase n=1 Tax=Haliea sp. E1-2-M8 TaxID=3064706 RepID=UPI002721AD83|nr:C69 family dipeptidase [Haliea sp. E1-2-M8]MDO8861725.1 C69 family dipeptidase [Haliea sp. E1-2-M8]